eukprot:COSAG01_NODE_2895_length_6901_cov_35.009262_7_plen_104_part_00
MPAFIGIPKMQPDEVRCIHDLLVRHRYPLGNGLESAHAHVSARPHSGERAALFVSPGSVDSSAVITAGAAASSYVVVRRVALTQPQVVYYILLYSHVVGNCCC